MLDLDLPELDVGQSASLVSELLSGENPLDEDVNPKSGSSQLSTCLSKSTLLEEGGDQECLECPWLLPPWPPPVDESMDVDVPNASDWPEEVVVCRVCSTSTFTVSLGIADQGLSAVIDTAAEVTILSDKIYAILQPQPPIVRNVTLSTAGRNMKMRGMIVGPVNMTLGKCNFTEIIYVAPIDDDMLLGVDSPP